MTCDATGAGCRPSRSHTCASMAGSRCANVPTAPDNLPTLTTARARSRRSRSRCSSAYHSASLSPKVIGSACTPGVPPLLRLWGVAGLGGGELDLEPRLVTPRLAPDGAHLDARVALDHRMRRERSAKMQPLAGQRGNRRPEHGRGERPVREQFRGHAAHVVRGHTLDPGQRLVEAEMAVEVDFLARQ